MFYFFFCLISSLAYSQNLDQAMESLAEGQSGDLANFMNSTVELCINDKTEILSRAEASYKLQSFLNTVQPVGITNRHKGSSLQNSSNYRVARLLTKTQNYRLFLYLESSGQKVTIKEIRLDKE